MFRNGFYFDSDLALDPFFNDYGTSPFVGYVDPKTGEKVVYCKSSRKKSSRLPATPLSLFFDKVKSNYDEEHGDFFRHDKIAAEKRISDIKQILIDNRKKAEADFKDFYYSDDEIRAFVSQKESDRLHARYARQKRFLRCGFFNRDKWNWFCTFTWDPALFSTSDDWQKSLLRFFANIAERHHVQILGAFEYGDDNGRLHFHCLLSDPEKYFSDFKTKNTFSKKDRRYKNVKESVLMRQKFGINEFDSIDNNNNDEVRNTLLYCCYYAIENDGRTYYSRHMPSAVLQFMDISKECYYCGEEGVLKLLIRPGYEWDLSNFGKDKIPLRKTILRDDKYVFKDAS